MISKSEKNLGAAQKLIDNKFYTPSVHCSYYAVFQRMQYVLANLKRNSMTYDEQEKAFEGGNSHESIIIEIKNRVFVKPREQKTFSENIRSLKRNRVEADYKIRDFTDIESMDCLQSAKQIISELNRCSRDK